MSAPKSIRSAFARAFRFSGRSSRAEFWWFAAFVLTVTIAGRLVGQLLWAQGRGIGSPDLLSGFSGMVLSLPLLSCAWRRLHDTGRHGRWLLLPLAIGVGLTMALMGGIAGFSLLEAHVPDREMLRRPAALLGGAGMALAAILQALAMGVLLLWLAQQGQPDRNRYGEPPEGAEP